MTKSALEWQIKIRKFVDNELIPWKYMQQTGNLPSDIGEKHSDMQIKLGLPAWEYQKEGGLSFQCLSK